jgi:membrane protease YdiL (CAAX protease family)
MRPAALAFVAASVLVTAVASYLAFQPERSGTLAMWALAGGPTVLLALVAAAWARREELLRDWLVPRWGDFTRGLLGALALYAAAWAFTRVVTPASSPRALWVVSLYGQIGNPRDLQAHALLVGANIGVVVVAEEILWRGMVTQLLADRLGSRTAWLWAAGLYALAYVPTLWALGARSVDPVLVLAALSGGLLWGWMARMFGRLGPGIVAHALFDWIAVMMLPLWGLGQGW